MKQITFGKHMAKMLAVVVMAVGIIFPTAGPLLGEAANTSFQEEKGIFVLKGWFHTEASPMVIWNVLTDYDHISDFVTSMKSSKVVQYMDSGPVVDQRAIGSFLIFSFDINVLLWIKETPLVKIEFEDHEKKNFKNYQGSWTIEQDLDGKNFLVSYTLKATPNFFLPGVFAEGIFKDNASSLMEAVKKEVEARDRKMTLQNREDMEKMQASKLLVENSSLRAAVQNK